MTMACTAVVQAEGRSWAIVGSQAWVQAWVAPGNERGRGKEEKITKKRERKQKGEKTQNSQQNNIHFKRSSQITTRKRSLTSPQT